MSTYSPPSLLYSILTPYAKDIKFVVREFVTIPVDGEFRGFVYEGKLVALSQYDTMTFFPHLVEHKEEVEKRIRDFYEDIKDSIPLTLTSYIIDFAGTSSHYTLHTHLLRKLSITYFTPL